MWARLGVAHLWERLRAGTPGVVKREIVTARWHLDVGDRACRGIITFQDDVDLIVDVLGVAVVVDDTVSQRLTKVR